MADWNQQRLSLDFTKEKDNDGSIVYTLNSGHRRQVYWTRITVKQVGRPSPDAWQVTYSRSEIQIGLWKIHNATKDIKVTVHTSPAKLIEDIANQKKRKPSFLARISN